MKQFKHVYCNVKGLGSSDYFKIDWINLPLITVGLLESTVVQFSWYIPGSYCINKYEQYKMIFMIFMYINSTLLLQNFK